MSDYRCARCGSSDVSESDDVEDDDGYADEDRPLGWCNDCGDYRYLDD